MDNRFIEIKQQIYNDFLNNDVDIVNQMKNTTHSYVDESNNIIYNIHHLEDDVWSHVNLMYNEFNNLIDKIYDIGHTLTEKDIIIIAFSILLHDIGKIKTKSIITKKDGNKKVIFYNHAECGSFEAIDIINKYKNKYDLNENDVIKIIYCINHHMNFFVDISGSLITTDNFSYKFGNNIILKESYKYLYLVNVLDNYGRLKKNMNTQDKYDFNFSNEYNRIIYFQKYNKNKVLKEYKNKVILLCGIPATGKTTYINEMFKKDDYIIASTDDIIMQLGHSDNYTENFKNVDFNKVENIFNDILKNAYNNKKDVIIDQTNLTRKSRARKLKLFNGYEKHIITFLAGPETIIRNNNNRRIKNNKFIDEKIINNMVSKFQYPTCDEANIINIIMCELKSYTWVGV